jgi:serine/threonine protein kinase
MASRLPSQPPQLTGLTYVRPLGEGGFADVFLFQQSTPQREVAVKVLRPEIVDEQVIDMFRQEANHMAKLSPHPSILTIYSAGISADGRPHMLMEVCPSSMGKVYRQKSLPVSEVLTIGIKMASALETAHREKVLHRDIKPSNILKTTFGSYVLSDFGIAASIAQNNSQQMFAMSVPWSSPEVVSEETIGTVASEIWSLGATLYSLLAGRTPFEIDDAQQNSRAHLKKRIIKADFRPTGNPGSSPELERVLARAMSKKPEERQESMLQLGLELQQVQVSLGLSPTQIEVADNDWATPSIPDSEEKRWEAPHVVATESKRKKRSRVPEPAFAADGDFPLSNLPSKKLSKSTWIILAALVALGAVGFLVANALLSLWGVN